MEVWTFSQNVIYLKRNPEGGWESAFETLAIRKDDVKYKPKDLADKFSCSVLKLLYRMKLEESKNALKDLERMDFLMERFGFKV